METITLKSEALTLEISPLGAEIQRIVDASGHDRLWDGDPAFWKGRAPVLFPLSGALKDDTYILRGQRYQLGKHGFARGSLFTVEAADATSATFLLTPKEASPAGFPFEYAFRVRYQLRGNALQVDYITENCGTAPFCFGVGAHEAYACPEGIEAYELVFEKPEDLERSVLEGPFLTGETEAVPTVDGRVLPLHAGLFSNDTLVLAGLESRSVTLRSHLHSRQVRVDFADFPYLLVWTMPGAGYVCLEPWSNLPDRLDTNQDIGQKPGMVCLAGGQGRTFTHTITFS